MKKHKGKQKRILYIMLGIVGVLTLIYFIGVGFYSTRFCPGTKLKAVDCSNLTVSQATEKLEKMIEDYNLILVKKHGRELISGKEIDLRIKNIGNIDIVLESQNSWLWFMGAIRNNQLMSADIGIDEEKLNEKIENLVCVSDSRRLFENLLNDITYDSDLKKFISKSTGNGCDEILNQSKLSESIKEDIYNLEPTLDLNRSLCYVNVKNGKEMKGALEKLNKLVSAKISYKDINGVEVAVLDADTINLWLGVNENFEVWLNEDAVFEYMKELAKSFDTVGKERKFKTSDGNEIVISGGDYGWLVNKTAEKEAVKEIIVNGEMTERTPLFSRNAKTIGETDFGNTYVEVSLDKQKLWFYKDGALVVTSGIVSGNSSLKRDTHKGLYSIKFKEKNATLKGEGYSTPVAFWMPFNGGQGLHDATWRGAFGGAIYKTNGSHGCVNLPMDTARKIFEKISPGDPVIVY